MTRTFLLTAACLAVAFGCAPPAPTELSDDDRAAIQQYFDELVQTLTPEDNRAWANLFTEDAQFMYANQPTLRGREALYEWGESDDSAVLLSISFSDMEIHGSGDWAWVTLNQELTIEGVEGSVRGKALTVVQRQPDGTWLTAATSGSPDQPAPGN